MRINQEGERSLASRVAPQAQLLLIALLAGILLNGVLIAGLIAYGIPPGQALRQTAPGLAQTLTKPSGNDSWKPMARAQRRFDEQPDDASKSPTGDASLYRVFFDDRIKFQYPPSALFVLDLFPSRWFDGPESLQPGTPMNGLLTWASRAGIALIILGCMLLYEKSWQLASGEFTTQRRDRLVVIACWVLLGATLAAPVAWEHHYGILLPIFALAAPHLSTAGPVPKPGGVLLLASYLMTANALLRPEWLLRDPVRELLASHLFFGALLLFALLASERLQPDSVDPIQGHCAPERNCTWHAT